MDNASSEIDVMAGVMDEAPAPAGTHTQSMGQNAQGMSLFKGGSITPDPADQNLLVRFFLKSVRNKAKDPLDPACRDLPDYVEREYIDIRVPGSKESRAQPVQEIHKQRFPNHYDAFKRRVAPPVSGTPLSEWAGIPRNMVEQLTFSNVKTVEQLASLSDVHAQNFRGIQKYVSLAKAFVEEREKLSGLETVVARLEKAEADTEAYKKQNAELMARLDKLEAGNKPKTAQKRAVQED